MTDRNTTFRSIAVDPFGSGDAIPSFALIQVARTEDVQMDRWTDYLQGWMGTRPGERGLLSARSRRGSILGVTPWWLQPALYEKSEMWAGPHWVCEPGARPLVTEALENSLRARANAVGCGRLVLVREDRLETVRLT